MKINEYRGQNTSLPKISGRLKDVLGVFDKITINSASEPDLSVYGKVDFNGSHGKIGVTNPEVNRWILDGMEEAGHGSGPSPSPGSSHHNPCQGHNPGIPPGPSGHIPGAVPHAYSQQFNDVMNVLNNISYQGNSMSSKLSYAGNDISASKNELVSTHNTIEEVKNDTGETDVSSKGQELASKMTSVEYKLQEGDRYIDSATNDFSTVKSYLNDALNRIDYLRSQLQSAGPYQQVVAYLDQAKQHINNPLANAGTVEWDLYNTDSYMKRAGDEIGYTGSYISTIKGDYEGTSVSSEGVSVQYYVENAERALDNANSELAGTTGSYLPSLRSEIEQAISSLRYAQNMYNSIR